MTGSKDHQGGSLDYYKRRQEVNKQLGLHGEIVLGEEKYRGKLNPRWVEQLMGLPVGWVQPSCSTLVITELTSLDSLGTESSPTQQLEPSEHYGETCWCGWKSKK
jgi:hypothetical protein